MNDYLKRTWAEINLNHIAGNVKAIQACLRPGCQMMGVVKADAYGHGDKYAADCLRRQGVTWFGVSNLEEALSLRRQGFTENILIFGITPASHAGTLACHSITHSVFSLEYAEKLSAAAAALGVEVPVHIKLDTGMGRIGFSTFEGPEQAAACAGKVYGLSGLKPSGIFTHFAVADESSEESRQYTLTQFKRFEETCGELERKGFPCGLRHCCNSAAMLGYPEMHLDMVRPGNIIYGLYPSIDCLRERKINLNPAMELKSMVSMVKEMDGGRSVSYGRTYETQGRRIIATVPIGYADGYTRRLSNKARVLIHGQYAPQVGNVCMDQMMVDVTDIAQTSPVREGDIVTLFGRQGGREIPVEELAELTGTINYEIVCVLGRRVPRIYIENGEKIAVVDYIRNTL